MGPIGLRYCFEIFNFCCLLIELRNFLFLFCLEINHFLLIPVDKLSFELFFTYIITHSASNCTQKNWPSLIKKNSCPLIEKIVEFEVCAQLV